MWGDLCYAFPADNVAALASLSLTSGAADASYPLTNLVDKRVDKPFKTTGTAGATALFDFTTARRLDWVVMPMHNIPAAANVRFQGHSTTNFTTPTVDAPMVIAPYGADGFPYSVWVDLTTKTGYTTTGLRYWRIVVPNISKILAIGDLILNTTLRRFDRHVQFGVRRPMDRPDILQETEGGAVFVHDRGTTLRKFVATVRYDDTGYEALKTLWLSAKGRVHPFPIVIDADVNDAWFVRWMSPFDPAMPMYDIHDLVLDWREESRGLEL